MGSEKSFETGVVAGNHMKSYGDFHPNVQFYPAFLYPVEKFHFKYYSPG
jgi:hypothetical protein